MVATQYGEEEATDRPKLSVTPSALSVCSWPHISHLTCTVAEGLLAYIGDAQLLLRTQPVDATHLVLLQQRTTTPTSILITTVNAFREVVAIRYGG